MFCKYCGAKSAGAGFCARCGKPFSVSNSEQVPRAIQDAGVVTTQVTAPTTATNTAAGVTTPTPSGHAQAQGTAQTLGQATSVDTRRSSANQRGDRRDPRKRGGGKIALVVTLSIVMLGGAGVAAWWLLGGSTLFEPASNQVTQGTYGSDAQLDEMWDRCQAGVLSACDELYFASPSGSDYEAFGASCGNREGSPGLCEQASPGTEQLEGGFGADPELDLLWVECEEGNMFACDDLFFESPPGTGYEQFGATCGNRGDDSGQCVGRF